VFYGGSNQEESDGRSMWHVWERGELLTGYGKETSKTYSLKDKE
jgi:hypothetical protein